MTVATTASPRSSLRSCEVERGDREDLVAVDELALFVDRDDPVGVAVEREARRSPARPGPLAARSSGWVEPQSALMFAPSGDASSTSTVAPSARSAVGATRNAAPFPQSSTTCNPVRWRPSQRRRRARRRSRRARCGARSTRPRRRHRARARAGSPPARASSCSTCISTDSGNFRPPAREQLDAVVGERVVAGRDHRTRRAPLTGEAPRRPGVGSTPASTTSAPSAQMPGDQRRLEHRTRAARVAADQERLVVPEDPDRGRGRAR